MQEMTKNNRLSPLQMVPGGHDYPNFASNEHLFSASMFVKSSEMRSKSAEDFKETEDYIDVVNTFPTEPETRYANTPANISHASSSGKEASSPESSSSSNADGKKARTIYTPQQIESLLNIFKENPYPEAEEMENLATDMKVSEKKIKVWFQNKRARWRRKQEAAPIKMSPECPAGLPYVPSMPPMMTSMSPYGYYPAPMMYHAPFSSAVSVMPQPYGMYPGSPGQFYSYPPSPYSMNPPITPYLY